MRRVLLVAVVATLAAAPAQAQSWAVRETALARAERARSVAADPELVKAVRAKNALRESLEEIKRKDKEWTDKATYPLRKELSTSACAQRLRALTKDDPIIAEVILMDAQGANVCVTPETSDYWQGDEAKYLKTFAADKPVFVDEPALDASTGVYAIQLSVLVFDNGTKIGALTFTLKIRREDAGSPRTP